VGEVTPQAETCSNATDDDCNGQTNEGGAGCACAPNTTASCYSGPAGTAGVGLCVAGSKTCNALGTAYGACTGEVLPQSESCSTTGDDNCNGQSNEGCICAPSSTASCYSGPAGTQGVGLCVGGTKTCNAAGTAYGACVGEVTPQTETCTTPGDDNCNGQVNESGAGCVCAPSSTASCYSGPAGTQGVGLCVAGTKTCNALGTAYGSCVGEVTPQTETCTTPGDDNCNGQTNESGTGCVCSPGSTGSCYTGPAGTVGVGLCKAGTQVCNAQGTAYGACTGDVVPVAETCATVGDDNCNGQTNEGGAGCVCTPNATTGCYPGPAGTAGVGICKAGTQVCNAQGTALGACTGSVVPQLENCALAPDENCDGSAPACAGTHLWSHNWGGVQDEEGNSLAVDAADNVIVGGYVTGPVDVGCGALPVAAGVDSAALIKLTPGGVCTWSKSFGTGSQVTGVAVDPSGNILATGVFSGTINLGAGVVTSLGVNDGFIAKFDASGTPLWSKTFGDPAAQSTDSVASDAQGNVYALGYFAGTINLGGAALASLGSTDLYLVKYSPTGTHLWSKRFGDNANQSTTHGLAVDTSGNVVITGTAYGTFSFGGATLATLGGGDTFVAKFDTSGVHAWSKIFGDTSNQIGSGIAVDTAGDVYLSGFFLGTVNFGGASLPTAGLADSYLAKLSPSGAHLWSMRGGGVGNQSAVNVTVDRVGNVVMIGNLTGSGSFGGPVLTSAGNNDILVAKYDSGGAYLWSKAFGDASSQGTKGVATDSLGNILFTGIGNGTVDYGGGPLPGFGGEDVVLVKLGP
jgi:hypothetical protein